MERLAPRILKPLFTILFLAIFTLSQAQPSRDGKNPAEPYCSGLFASVEGTYLDLEAEPNVNTVPGYLNILDWLQGRVAGLQVYSTRVGRIPVIRNQLATIYLDEMRVDPSVLDAIPVMDIAAIKIIRQPYVLGGPGGIIAVYTKRGEEEEE